MSIDLVCCYPRSARCEKWCLMDQQSVDGRFTASGHENGGIYIFNNDSGRLFHSLPSKSSTNGEC